MKKYTFLKLLLSLFVLFSCTESDKEVLYNSGNKQLVSFKDEKTTILYQNLHILSKKGKIMFGMANPTTISYSGGPFNHDINQSDCKDIVGSHPAYYESDFMWYDDTTFKAKDIKAMQEAYKRGAVCGYCWHIRGKNSLEFYAKQNGKFTSDKDLVREIISSNNRTNNSSLNWFLNQLDSTVIPVLKELNFPIVFRPFHEMNGNWFWWGADNCTKEEYIELYQLTVNYLKENGIYNILYAWSANINADLDYYPGNEYVDILGLDTYEPGITAWNQPGNLINELSILTDFAAKNGKVAAITETGCRKEHDQFRYPDTYPKFWTENLLNPILNNEKAKRIVWIMSWYNADWNNDKKGQLYIPYKNMKRPNSNVAVDDFVRFYQSEHTLFEDDLPDMYNVKNQIESVSLNLN